MKEAENVRGRHGVTGECTNMCSAHHELCCRISSSLSLGHFRKFPICHANSCVSFISLMRCCCNRIARCKRLAALSALSCSVRMLLLEPGRFM